MINASDDYRTRALLRILEFSGEKGELEANHHKFERDIACWIHIGNDRASGTHDRDWADECERIEASLGLAFVAAQRFITTVRSRCKEFRRFLERQENRKSGLPENPYRESTPLSGAIGYPAIEVVNAVANYWKHVDEWPITHEETGDRRRPVWVPSRGQERTVEIAVSLGLSPGCSTGNMREAASKVGVTTFSDLSVVRRILFDWADGLRDIAKKELQM